MLKRNDRERRIWRTPRGDTCYRTFEMHTWYTRNENRGSMR